MGLSFDKWKFVSSQVTPKPNAERKILRIWKYGLRKLKKTFFNNCIIEEEKVSVEHGR